MSIIFRQIWHVSNIKFALSDPSQGLYKWRGPVTVRRVPSYCFLDRLANFLSPEELASFSLLGPFLSVHRISSISGAIFANQSSAFIGFTGKVEAILTVILSKYILSFERFTGEAVVVIWVEPYGAGLGLQPKKTSYDP